MSRVPTPRRGRPPVADAADLRRRAIDVVLRDGYAAVTMSRIASEIGISVRTLHRYFPTKSDLVWGALDPSFEALRAHLAAAPDDVPLLEVVVGAVTATAGAADDDPATREVRERLLATTPELQANRSEAFRRWREELRAFVARRLGVPEGGVVAEAAASALQAATMASLHWWAVNDESSDPAPAFAEGLRGLGALADA